MNRAELATAIRDDVAALLRLLPDAEARQWDVSSVPRPRDEDPRPSVGGAPSDPTADIALDPARLALRAAVERVDPVLLHAAVATAAARDALEAALRRHAG